MISNIIHCFNKRQRRNNQFLRLAIAGTAMVDYPQTCKICLISIFKRFNILQTKNLVTDLSAYGEMQRNI